MAPRPILRWPDPCLSQPAAAVEGVTDATRALIADMFDTMYAAAGRGLAAPQIGVLQRIFVMDVTWKEGPKTLRVFVNPDLLWHSTETATGPEGCLSIPGVVAEVTRRTSVRMRWLDGDGVRQTGTLTGFAAVCAQHEYDHLDGIVTFDRLEPQVRARLEAAFAA